MTTSDANLANYSISKLSETTDDRYCYSSDKKQFNLYLTRFGSLGLDKHVKWLVTFVYIYLLLDTSDTCNALILAI